MAKTVSAGYPISTSPLFGIRSKRRLADVLEVNFPILRSLQLLGNKAFTLRLGTPKPGKKAREVQDPIVPLKNIHKRLNRLLQRVSHPPFVQAGLKGSSYIKNAAFHPPDEWVCTIDVQSFYPNCKRERIYQFFRRKMNCAPDVSELLTDLSTFNDHLPTGGPFSLLLSYWSNHDVFEQIYERASTHGLKMTLYVDDLTFSGKQARPKFLNDQVKPILMAAGLIGHKIKSYSPTTPKHITGVVRTNQGSKVPFRRARKIRDCYEQFGKAESVDEKLDSINRLVSSLHEAAQVDGKYLRQAESIMDCRRNLKDLQKKQ